MDSDVHETLSRVRCVGGRDAPWKELIVACRRPGYKGLRRTFQAIRTFSETFEPFLTKPASED